MDVIAAVSISWGIGRNNDLLFHIKEDMRRFRTLTSGGTVIMGRKNLESLPGGAPLPKRRNIVLTRNPSFHREGTERACSVEEVLAMTAGEDNVWVIGGGEIYAALLPYCQRCLITKVEAEADYDTMFPNLDRHPDWLVEEEGEPRFDGALRYRFVTYRNRTL